MPPLKIEFSPIGEEHWRQAGLINPGDAYGSISDNNENGRDIYYFGIDAIEGSAVVKKSEAGIDVETAHCRVIHSLGNASLVASLMPGEVHEIAIRTDRSSRPLRIRFTHLAE